MQSRKASCISYRSHSIARHREIPDRGREEHPYRRNDGRKELFFLEQEFFDSICETRESAEWWKKRMS